MDTGDFRGGIGPAIETHSGSISAITVRIIMLMETRSRCLGRMEMRIPTAPRKGPSSTRILSPTFNPFRTQTGTPEFTMSCSDRISSGSMGAGFPPNSTMRITPGVVTIKPQALVLTLQNTYPGKNGTWDDTPFFFTLWAG